MKLISLILFVTFAMLSCEDDEIIKDECSRLSELEIAVTEVENDDKTIVTYNLTPNNAEFTDLEYTWTVNGQAVSDEKAPSSLLNLTLTNNGTFDVCMTPVLEEGSNCIAEPICTVIKVDSIEMNEDCQSIVSLLDTINNAIIDDLPEIDDELLASILEQVTDIAEVSLVLNGEPISIDAIKNIIASSSNKSIAELLSEINGGNTNRLLAIIESDLCNNQDRFTFIITINPNLGITIGFDMPSIDDAKEDEKEDEIKNQNPDNPIIDEEKAPEAPAKQLSCDDITIEGGVLQNDINGQIFNRGRAFFKVTRIEDANYTWTVNGQTLTAQERQDLTDGGVLFTPIDSGDFHSSNFRLGSGTHTIEVFVTSPTVCPNGKTVTSTLSIPTIQ